MINSKLAKFAVDEEKSRGRLHQETYDDSKYRSVFGRDRVRIINSSAFRRLQYKTQVFVNHIGDHYRTRLTHSLEVGQIARWIAGALKVNKDLAEIVSLAHDIGHPPFGHAGEDALHDKMKEFGGFYHNSHALKLITKIETRFIEFEGLNLSWEMLEGVVKHNGPLADADVCEYISHYNSQHDLDLKNFSSIEAQISAISDDIAYNNHDIEDGLRAQLFTINDLLEVPLVGKIYAEILAKHSNLRDELIIGEAKKLITLAMVVDVIENTQKNIELNNIQSESDVRNLGKSTVTFSAEMEKSHQAIKKFLMKNMYRHELVNGMTESAKKIVSSLFDFYFENPRKLPKNHFENTQKISTKKELAILVSDYIAGMTDRFAIKEFEEKINN
jgi:dGTPase